MKINYQANKNLTFNIGADASYVEEEILLVKGCNVNYQD